MSQTDPHPDQAANPLQEGLFDVLVIGGGIVGAGIARDAAMRGLRTGLVEQSDFAFGTSSRSSRLLHGGIRYLAQGRIGLVREANKEKTIIHRIAPHLAQPLPFIFPTRKGIEWARWKLSLGVKLYDMLCGLRRLGRSSSLSAQETLRLLPDLSTSQLTGSVRYFDALTNDARLVLDTLRSAARYGAGVRNYVRFVNAERHDNVWRCQLEDVSTATTFEVQARAVVNATGPWSDRIPHSKTSLRLTKGIHLVIDRSRLPVPEAVVITEGDRVLFAIPWGERVILGTTDTDYDGPLDHPPCDEEDIQYILDVMNSAFPSVQLQKSDVLSTWAGLRPLVADARGNPSDISRRHEITMSHPGWWDVTGGKLTTYRLMAEETVNEMVKRLGVRAAPCKTAVVPLLENGQAGAESGILPPEVAPSVVEHYCLAEWARHVDDVMVRRTSWCYYHRDHLQIATQVAQWMAQALGWNDTQTQAEIARYRELMGAAAVRSPHFSPNGAMNGDGAANDGVRAGTQAWKPTMAN